MINQYPLHVRTFAMTLVLNVLVCLYRSRSKFANMFHHAHSCADLLSTVCTISSCSSLVSLILLWIRYSTRSIEPESKPLNWGHIRSWSQAWAAICLPIGSEHGFVGCPVVIQTEHDGTASRSKDLIEGWVNWYWKWSAYSTPHEQIEDTYEQLDHSTKLPWSTKRMSAKRHQCIHRMLAALCIH